MSFSSNPWVLATRPRTLPAAVAPVLVGSCAAFAAGAFVLPAALICLLFALLMQVTTNFANDYFDHVNGVDTEARVGPTRAVASGQITPRAMLAATLGVTLLALVVGLVLISYGGWWLLPVGILCAVCAIAYTGGPYPLGYNGLGDVFAFLFFGPIAVGGTYYVQTGSLDGAALWAGTGVGLLVANILVVNNYRDRDTDAESGKRTLIVRFGRDFGWCQYVVCLVVAMLVPLLIWLGCGGPAWVLLAWLALPLGLRMAAALRAGQGRELNKLLGKTALLAMLYSVLLSIGFLLG